MMLPRLVIPVVMVLVSGCSSLPVSRDADIRARRHLEVADSLERATSLREAALEYAIVAEHYAGTLSYETAVYKTALLYCDPLNPAADDSTALHWLAICRRIEMPEDEARTVRVAAALFERVRVLREQMAHMSASSDALTAQAKRQNAALGIHVKRIQELEEELKRLKEIDLRMSRTRQKE